ncbi:hypothetical protein CEPID_08255 [Corynebacterium epidermidicanis]|uniref:Uncharacterized protein n=2 Tax=Corynebacterium epidermidicanis TaxID=1050174 RepID=A0A0G3GQM4_9CORY|nr:hypothetical protein CEPID_08255 [Corynebacterium epidermidicanis]
MRKTVAGLAALIIVVAIVGAGFDDNTSKPMLRNGDQLGMEPNESFSQYQQRVVGSLDRDGDGWALVTFDHPLTVEEAGRVTATWNIQRVSSLTLTQAKPVAIPEPIAPETRADVVRRTADSSPEVAGGISGALVFARLAQLRTLAQEPTVVAIEVLPRDAAFGRFGVRPVVVG